MGRCTLARYPSPPWPCQQRLRECGCSAGASANRHGRPGLVLTLDELEFADMVVVAESAEEQAAIAESVFAARGLQ